MSNGFGGETLRILTGLRPLVRLNDGSKTLAAGKSGKAIEAVLQTTYRSRSLLQLLFRNQ